MLFILIWSSLRSIPWDRYHSAEAGDPFLWGSLHQILWEVIMSETDHQRFPGSIRQQPDSLLEMARFSSSSPNNYLSLTFPPPICHHLLWMFTLVFLKSSDLSLYCPWYPFSAFWILFLYNVKCHLRLKIFLSPILPCTLTQNPW